MGNISSITKRLASYLLTILYSIQNRRATSSLLDKRSELVISLTSYGQRVSRVHLAIESIASGEALPSQIFLWLDDVPNLSELPATIKRLQARGLIVAKCPNYGPHKKYFPFVAAQDPLPKALVTADDDVFYPANWLADLARAFLRNPECVHCHRASVIDINGDGAITPYITWEPCLDTAPRYRNFPKGAGGVLYPMRLLEQLRQAETSFLRCCPRADDVWLHKNAVETCHAIRQVAPSPRDYLGIPGSQAKTLTQTNVHEGENDIQIRATYSSSDLIKLKSERVG